MLEELLDLEHQGWTSLCNSTGADFYGQIMASDGVMVLAHGQVFDRQAVIESLNEVPPWRSYDIADQRLVALSDDHAVLVYTGRAYRDEDEPAFIARMSSVYNRQDGTWRLALYQQTPIPSQA
ncbi:nuclear transport factor 2 family protein [Corynebacterium suedekumii]|uniref:Nuclear transport factor 2 family protein n=1 Tax=Corynebacterium suedekumii TaxID=3049801 RepID=A0ABY8VHS9_9CORY|nr:nuclear transport factor 2 family protein [Corynebacterium suedekumii]WIM69210.1 nuclear transport factor 2 family protein [Corynebacterium suedekumii]